MTRDYSIGAGCRSDDPKTFTALAGMCAEGRIDHIQVLVIPEERAAFKAHLDTLAASGSPVIIHAPHHGQRVNPCAPTAFEEWTEKEAVAYIEEAMAQAFEAADMLDAPLIVLHAGRYEDGGKEKAVSTAREFLATHPDPRIILENLPQVYAGYHLLGSTADALQPIGEGLISGYCLDFAHLYCTVNYFGLDYATELMKFEELPVRLCHLSNSERGSIRDQHLEIDHPNGGLDFATVIPYLKKHPGIPVSLEYKYNNAEVYERQLPVFDRLYNSFG